MIFSLLSSGGCEAGFVAAAGTSFSRYSIKYLPTSPRLLTETAVRPPVGQLKQREWEESDGGNNNRVPCLCLSALNSPLLK